MTKQQVYHIIEWGVAIAACGYLVWRLATYEDYAALGASLRAMGWKEWTAIVLCVALMPVNMAIEAWKWYSLMNEGVKELKNERVKELKNERVKELKNERVKELKNERLTFREAQRQVYYSKLAGLITPWRLGEYPARGVLMSEGVNELKNERIWPRVLSMGAVGSATMTFAIVAAGIGGLGILGGIGNLDHLDSLDQLGVGYWMIVGAVLLVLMIALVFAPRLLRRYAEVSHGLIMKSVGQSLVRLVCWCVQLALVLYALGAIFDFRLLIFDLPVYYLFVTITPNVPIAEVGVRGAWAITLFGSMNAALAGVLLWGINTLLPCLGWFFLRKNVK